MYILPVFQEREIRMPGVILECRLRCRKYIEKVGYQIRRLKELKACPISFSVPEMQEVPLKELLSNELTKFH